MAEATQELVLRVRAETAEAVRGVQETANSLAQLGLEQKSVEAALRSAQQAYREAGNATDAQRAEIVANVAALQQERVALIAKQQAMQGTTAGVRAAGSASSNAQQAMASFTNGLQDAVHAGGDVALMARYAGNNLSQMAQQFGYMATAAKASGQTTRQALASAFTGAGGVVIGISAAVAVLPVLIDLLERSGSAARLSADDYKDAADGVFDLDIAVQRVTFSTRGQLEAHIAATRAALEQAQAQATLEGSLGVAIERGGTMRDIVRAYGDVLDDATGRARRHQGVIDSLTESLNELTAAQEIANNVVGSFGPAALPAGFEAAINQGNFEVDNLFLRNPYAQRPDRSRGRKTRTAADEIQDFRSAMAGMDALLAAGLVTPLEVAEARASALESTIRDLFRLSKGQRTPAITQYIEDLEQARAAAFRAAEEQRRLLGARQWADRTSVPGRAAGRPAAGVLRGEDIERGAAAMQNLARHTAAGDAAMQQILASIRGVPDVAEPAIESVTRFQLALSEGLRAAGIEGTLAAVYGLSDALGELAVINLDGFADGVKRTMQDVVRSITSAILQALLLRGILAGLNLISPGLGTALGGTLGVAGIGNAAAPPANVNVTFGAGQYRNGYIMIPASATHAAWRDEENRRAQRGRTE